MILNFDGYTGEVWIIEDYFVCEPGVEGMQIGELPEFDLSKCKVVKRMTQEEYDALAEAFYQEHGHYPGQ